MGAQLSEASHTVSPLFLFYYRGGSGILKMVRPGSGCGHPVMCNQLLMGVTGCVGLGTDLFNYSKGLFSNRALDMFSECQYNMSFHVQKWPDISNGWSDIPSKKEAKKK